jgi:hypothetical protein
MNTITERCAQVRTSLKRFAAAKENEARAQELELRRKEIEEEHIRLRLVVTTAHILLHHDHLSASSIPDCSKALESCDKVGQLIASDPTAITKGREYNLFRTRVSKVYGELHGTVQSSWQSIVEQHPVIDNAFLRRIEVFPGQQATVQRIRELRTAFETAIGEVPSNHEAYDRFQNAYKALQEEVTKLDPEAFPEEVLQFFRAAQQVNGAPLAFFTDEVRDWLEKNDWINSIRVRFTGEK